MKLVFAKTSLMILLLSGQLLTGCGNETQITPVPQTQSTRSSTGPQTAATVKPSQTANSSVQPVGQNQSQSVSALPQAQSSVQPSVSLPPVAEPAVGGPSAPLTSGQVFDQGNTNWCWAYSAYHTLRTYYVNTKKTDAATVAWRNALMQLDSAGAFENYLASHVDRSQMGNPDEFVTMFQNDYKLPRQNWVSRYGADYSSDAIVNQLTVNLQKGIPSSYCNVGHCVMVYGVVNSGGSLQYKIADSSGGDTYVENANQLVAELDMVMYLEGA